MWRSLVAHLTGGQGVAGSNPVIPTIYFLIGKGLRTGLVHQPILDDSQLGQLAATPKEPRFDGDAAKFKLGVEAARLGLADEYDPYFSLSIARSRSALRQADC